MFKYSDIAVRPLRSHKYKLLHPVTFRGVTVPAGYRTNGADVPRMFWSLIPPNDSEVLPAVIIHDYLCDLGEYEYADDMFKAAMLELNVSKYKRALLYWAVSSYTKYVRPFQKV